MGYEKQLSPGYFNLVLDFNSRDVLTTLEVKQYDSYWLDLHFTQNGQLFDLSELYPLGTNPSLVLRVRRPDGKVIFNEIHEDNGEYTTFLSIKNLSKAGKVYADVALYTEENENTYIFSTQPFILNVVASPGLQGQNIPVEEMGEPIIDGTPSLPSDFFNVFQPYVDSNNILVLTGTGSSSFFPFSPKKGPAPVLENDVNFIDYDGTIYYSYSYEDFLELTSMPNNIYHAGLTSQGWNWTLSDAKQYVSKYHCLWIGQTYITSDGKTRIDIGDLFDLFPDSPFEISLNLDETAEVEIDWGDGTSANISGSDYSTTTLSHVYINEQADYVTISINVTGGKIDIISLRYDYPIKKIHIGNNVRAFSLRDTLSFWVEYITIPNTISEFNTRIDTDTHLRSITYPSVNYYRAASPYGYWDAGIMRFRNISWPKSFVGSADGFQNVISLEFLPFVTSLSLPEGMDEIVISHFNSLKKVIFPKNTGKIGMSRYFDALTDIYFMDTTPPEAYGFNFYSSTLPVIHVPRGCLSAYTSAENYPDPSTYSYVDDIDIE